MIGCRACNSAILCDSLRLIPRIAELQARHHDIHDIIVFDSFCQKPQLSRMQIVNGRKLEEPRVERSCGDRETAAMLVNDRPLVFDAENYGIVRAPGNTTIVTNQIV